MVRIEGTISRTLYEHLREHLAVHESAYTPAHLIDIVSLEVVPYEQPIPGQGNLLVDNPDLVHSVLDEVYTSGSQNSVRQIIGAPGATKTNTAREDNHMPVPGNTVLGPDGKFYVVLRPLTDDVPNFDAALNGKYLMPHRSQPQYYKLITPGQDISFGDRKFIVLRPFSSSPEGDGPEDLQQALDEGYVREIT